VMPTTKKRQLVVSVPSVEIDMSNAKWAKAKLSTVASFPENYFLENLAVRTDNSVLVTAFNHKQLWYVSTNGVGEACAAPHFRPAHAEPHRG
jgi:hypothetical protein